MKERRETEAEWGQKRRAEAQELCGDNEGQQRHRGYVGTVKDSRGTGPMR